VNASVRLKKEQRQGMKTSKYFEYVRRRPDRAMITDAWIREVIENPVETSVQSDGRFKKWAFIKGAGKYLRVICWRTAKRFITRSSIGVTRGRENESQVFCRHRYRIGRVH